MISSVAVAVAFAVVAIACASELVAVSNELSEVRLVLQVVPLWVGN